MPKADPKVRRRIRQMAEREWREPVLVLSLGDVDPRYQVPGRRRDGTVAGTRKVRRFFFNVLRYTFGGLANVVLSVMGGGAANILDRTGLVTGQPDGRAIDLVEAAERAGAAWLVRGESHLAVVDSGPLFRELPEPKIVWHATSPDTPAFSAKDRRLTWPDGSAFTFAVDEEEAAALHRHRRTELGL